MLRHRLAAMALLYAACSVSAQAATFAELFPERVYEPAEVQTILEGFDYKQGRVVIGDGLATLDVGPDYYFLNTEDSKTVLEVLWDNPEDDSTLGMLFPASMTPWDDASWGIVISYDAIGYVSDEDAGEIDYDDLLAQMQSDTREESKDRVERGYDSIELIGWAKTPYYDRIERKLHWAKELNFGGRPVNTLNYNIRILGRKGVLVMNFVAGMEALQAVEAAAPDILAMAEFSAGERYADFDPSLDEVAAVGVGGLIAGKVLAKTGLLAAGLLILKKFWFILLAPAVFVWKRITGRR